MKTVLSIYEGDKKVAEMPESDFWSMDGEQKQAFIRLMEMDGRTFEPKEKEEQK